MTVSAVASLAVGGFVVWALVQPPPPVVARFAIPLPNGQDFTAQDRRMVAVSPDGSQVVYVADGRLWLRPVDQMQAAEMPGTEEAVGPFFSADGESVGFWASDQLRKVSVTGGAPVRVADVPASPMGASWGADDMILYVQGGGIMQVPGAGGTPTLLIPDEEGEGFNGPQMLPGGEWVLFTIHGTTAGSWETGQVVVQSVTSGERTVIVSGGRDGRYLSSGRVVYTLNGVLLAVAFDVDSRQVLGGPVPLVEDVRAAFGGINGSAQFATSTTGTLVYVPGYGTSTFGAPSALVWVDRTGREELVGAESASYSWPRLSPDGAQVAVSTDTAEGTHLWVIDVARGTGVRFTFEGSINWWPAWTPDGEWITFASNRAGGPPLLHRQRADGSGAAESLLSGESSQVPASWSPDGQMLAFYQITGSTGRDLWMMNAEGESSPFLATEFSERVPMFSPDGQWLAYVSNESGRDEVYVRLASGEGGRQVVSTGGGTEPMWVPSGQELFYRQDQALVAVTVDMGAAFTVGSSQVLFEGPYSLDAGGGGNLQNYDVHPDGERFLMIKPMESTDGAVIPQINVVLNWFEELKVRVPVN